MNERAILYRRMNQIPEEWGTAVNVQAMVFGNMGNTSATGVALPVMPQRENDISMVNTSSTRKVKTWWPECVLPNR